MSIPEAEHGVFREVEELRYQETESWRERREEALPSSKSLSGKFRRNYAVFATSNRWWRAERKL
jgi:hypothetical protein